MKINAVYTQCTNMGSIYLLLMHPNSRTGTNIVRSKAYEE